MKTIIVDVPKYRMPQNIGRQCTFIVVRKVCIIMCLCRCSFQRQQYAILPSCHDNHVVRRPPYLNLSIQHVNRMALLSNVHKKQQVPLQLRKIENIMQKKFQDSKQFEHDGANSYRFENRSIYKAYCTIYIFIQLFKEVSLKIHVASCTNIKQPNIFPRRK
jgi:hypothetical protein